MIPSKKFLDKNLDRLRLNLCCLLRTWPTLDGDQSAKTTGDRLCEKQEPKGQIVIRYAVEDDQTSYTPSVDSEFSVLSSIAITIITVTAQPSSGLRERVYPL